MEKLKSFRITALHMEGFKSYSQPTDLTFGDPTVITGGNGRGKSSIADAIAFAVTGLPFFGEHRIDRLHSEDSRLSRNQTHLMANSIYIIDDAKQRQKMTEEFYSAVKKEIAEYQERADYFIKSGCQSPSVMDRWVLKIQSLEGKKQHYEDVLRRELDGLDDDFATLKLLSQELSFRAQTIRAKKAA